MDNAVPSKSRFDLYRTVTDKIIQAIEIGVDPCVMPWHGVGGQITRPMNASTGAAYRGINVVALWATAASAGFKSGLWASYKQWTELGGQVRKGEHGAVIVFFKEIERENDQPVSEEDAPKFVARASRVFNVDQVDGWKPPEVALPSRVDRIGRAENFVTQTGANIRHGSEQACYRSTADYIEMPSPESFCGTQTSSPTESYYAVLLHELTHWTGAKHRLDRELGWRFGKMAYAIEELIAELGAAFLCADLRITSEPRPDHAAYISSWLEKWRARHFFNNHQESIM